jgi:mRNA-degrading endonuclease toxin of MazEF toxin-antitoxin module
MVQATSPERALTTHLSFKPNDTCRLLAPALHVPPSSAHFEKPTGQSAAEALVENNAASAAHSTEYFGAMICLHNG